MLLCSVNRSWNGCWRTCQCRKVQRRMGFDFSNSFPILGQPINGFRDGKLKTETEEWIPWLISHRWLPYVFHTLWELRRYIIACIKVFFDKALRSDVFFCGNWSPCIPSGGLKFKLTNQELRDKKKLLCPLLGRAKWPNSVPTFRAVTIPPRTLIPHSQFLSSGGRAANSLCYWS